MHIVFLGVFWVCPPWPSRRQQPGPRQRQWKGCLHRCLAPPLSSSPLLTPPLPSALPPALPLAPSPSQDQLGQDRAVSLMVSPCLSWTHWHRSGMLTHWVAITLLGFLLAVALFPFLFILLGSLARFLLGLLLSSPSSLSGFLKSQ